MVEGSFVAAWLPSVMSGSEAAHERFQAFISDKPNGQTARMQAAKDKLLNAEEWLNCNIKLDLSSGDESKLEAKLGVNNLLKALIRKQSEGLLYYCSKRD